MWTFLLNVYLKIRVQEFACYAKCTREGEIFSVYARDRPRPDHHSSSHSRVMDHIAFYNVTELEMLFHIKVY